MPVPEEKAPLPSEENATEPVGLDGPEAVSVTSTVHTVEALTGIVLGVQFVTVVDVECFPLNVTLTLF